VPATGATAAVHLHRDADLEGALADWRRFRARKRLADVHWVDALYQAYLAALLAGATVLGAASIVGDEPVRATDALVADGRAVVGLVVAVLVGIGLRSGSRGGPLAVDRPDVRHVLLAPVDRVTALRGPSLRQLRFLVFVAAVAGATGGHLADRRIDAGNGVAWTAAGVLAAVATVALAHGLACCAAGLRMPAWAASGVAVVLAGWSAADVAGRVGWSPADALAGVALWPLEVRPVEVVAVAVSVVAVLAGLRLVGGTSLEQLERRSRLVGQIRFAATLQDLRTVVVLRRQLAQERPRTRPWLRLPLPRRSVPVLVRDVRALLRWPIGRLVRLVLLAAVAGVCARVAYEGTTPMIVGAGVALFLAGLDAAEPLGQELDHPSLRDSIPVPPGSIHVRHLPAVLAVSWVVAAVGAVAGVLVDPVPGAWPVALACVPAAGLGAASGAVVNLVMGAMAPAGTASSAWNLAPPEAAGVRLVYRTAWPPAIAVAGSSSILAARESLADGRSGTNAALLVGAGLAVLTGLVAGWVRFRDDISAWWATQTESMRPPAAASEGGAPS
jgi:hypothetical protein